MMGSGDCRLAPDYAEIALGRMEGDARFAAASGHYGAGAPPSFAGAYAVSRRTPWRLGSPCAAPRCSRRGRGAGKKRAPLTVEVPFRDAPAEGALAARFLPSAAALGPSETLVGAGSPAGPGLAGFLAGAAGEGAGARLVRAAEVERSPGWRMYPARVVDERFGRRRTGAASLRNMGAVMRRAALRGLGMAGAASDCRAALVPMSPRLRTDGQGSAAGHCTSRVRSRVRGATNLGTLWMHRLDYFGRAGRAGRAEMPTGSTRACSRALRRAPGPP